MIPMSDIQLGDVFSNPIHRGYGALSGCEWFVTEINPRERMIKLQAMSYKDGKPIGQPVWKRNTDRMISESWRIGRVRATLEDKRGER